MNVGRVAEQGSAILSRFVAVFCTAVVAVVSHAPDDLCVRGDAYNRAALCLLQVVLRLWGVLLFFGQRELPTSRRPITQKPTTHVTTRTWRNASLRLHVCFRFGTHRLNAELRTDEGLTTMP